MTRTALLPTRVLTPHGFETDRCILIDGANITAVLPAGDVPPSIPPL